MAGASLGWVMPLPFFLFVSISSRTLSLFALSKRSRYKQSDAWPCAAYADDTERPPPRLPSRRQIAMTVIKLSTEFRLVKGTTCARRLLLYLTRVLSLHEFSQPWRRGPACARARVDDGSRVSERVAEAVLESVERRWCALCTGHTVFGQRCIHSVFVSLPAAGRAEFVKSAPKVRAR